MSNAIFISAVVNTVLCVGLSVAGFMVMVANIMSGANMPPNYATVAISLGFIFPIIPIISIIGTWVSYKLTNPFYVKLFIGLPWVWCIIFLAIMLLIFKLISPDLNKVIK